MKWPASVPARVKETTEVTETGHATLIIGSRQAAIRQLKTEMYATIGCFLPCFGAETVSLNQISAMRATSGRPGAALEIYL